MTEQSQQLVSIVDDDASSTAILQWRDSSTLRGLKTLPVTF